MKFWEYELNFSAIVWYQGKKDLARMEVEDDEDDNDSVDEMLNDGPQQAEDDSDFDPEQDRQR